ncbi:venom dipeptidyl peptidase 4 isoform X2 [Anabrus simplex]|uniref:venom dipeptidyl peptidase 4 isoform X2 n=1 Tax=Anabrus simplex TaxID=316456 RepID=UPI0035A2FC64
MAKLTTVLTLWFASAVLTAKVDAGRKPFTLEEVISGELTAKGFGGTWTPDDRFLFTTAEGDLAVYDVLTGSNSTLVVRDTMKELGVSTYSMSADGQYLLLSYDTQAVFRHSTTAKFSVYNIVNRTVERTLEKGEYLQLAKWAPTGNDLAYVYQNNIYYSSMGIRLTSDGVPGVIYNGVPDWVYEEEVLGTGSAMWFSPDGKSLAYAKFDDTLVRTVSYMHYGRPGEDQYADVVTIRYPKPGTTNPHVELHVITDLVTGAGRVLQAPKNVTDDHVLWDVSWANDDEVIAVWMNRIQNESVITSYNVRTNASNDDFFINQERGWLQIPHQIVYNQTGETLATTLSWPQVAEGSSFSQLTLLRRNPEVGEQPLQPLTAGNTVVTNIYGWDTSAGRIYYQRTEPNFPSRRHVYVVSDKGGEPQCLSCDQPDCQYASASFSPNLKHFALSCSDRVQPPTISLYTVNSQTTPRIWQDNKELKEVLKKRILPDFIDDYINVTEKYRAQIRLWLPLDADLSGKTKYPTIVYVYAGPGSQQITDGFTLGFGAYVVTNRSYIYALIDGRGSAYKGDEMMFDVYENLGMHEVDDQIFVTRKLQEMYPFIDSSRTGIWGWSYGGYATAMTLARDKEGVFKCGISVAPVTSWIYYDSIYTERYMGLPKDNPTGYNNSDISRLAENFANKQFLLMHGNADDNVHYQQAMALARALELKNVLFSQQSYPDENHRIASVLLHVYQTQDRFWQQCFDGDKITTSGSAVNKIPLATLLLLLTKSAV